MPRKPRAREESCPTCGQGRVAVCQRCGNRFWAIRSDADYCGPTCRVAAHRAKKKRGRKR